MPTYRQSSVAQTIVIARPIDTITTVGVFGSADDYATARTEFDEEESLMIAGTVVAADGADLTGVQVQLSVNGVPEVLIALGGFYGGVNYFQTGPSMLPVGTHVITVDFPRTRR